MSHHTGFKNCTSQRLLAGRLTPERSGCGGLCLIPELERQKQDAEGSRLSLAKL